MANYEVLEPGGHAALVDGLKDYADRAGGTDTEQLADGSVGMGKLGDDVIDELDSKAYADGYYAQLTAGAADNLTARGDGVTASFLHRTTAGSASVPDEGEATVRSIKGRTLAWNQLVVAPFSAEGTQQGLTYTANADGSVHVQGTVTDGTSWRAIRTGDGTQLACKNGHKYLISGNISGTGSEQVTITLGGGKTPAGVPPCIVTATSDSMFWQRVPVDAVVDYVTKPMVIDLTAMFGAGNEPATVAEFEALYPLPYYAYDAGTLLPVRMTGVETNGFNQWDEQWEVGAIDGTTGQNVSASGTIRSKNYIPVFPGVTYYFKCGFHAGQSSNPALRFYDADKNFIGIYATSGAITPTNSEFTVPDNAHYLRFNMQTTYGATYRNDICINLSWSGYRNGEYEAYWSEQRTIAAIAENFPNGMRSAGTVCDELTETAAIHRVGECVVDGVNVRATGTMVGTGDNTSVIRATIALPSDALAITDAARTAFKASETFEYSANTLTSTAWQHGNAILYQWATQPSILVCIDGIENNTSAANAWLQAHPFTLHYPVTPTTTPFDQPINMDYKFADFGTERILVPTGQMSAPPTMDVAYGLNATDTLRTLPTEYISHASMSQFRLALMSHLGIFINETWDEVDNRYEYTITSE